VWAWAPTPNGTEFIPIYNGTGLQAVIGPGKLRQVGRGLDTRLWQGRHRRL